MECGPKPGVNRSDEKFEEFWQVYHELTQMPAVDKEMARRAWSKLNAYERGEARKNIEWYICEVGGRHAAPALGCRLSGTAQLCYQLICFFTTDYTD